MKFFVARFDARDDLAFACDRASLQRLFALLPDELLRDFDDLRAEAVLKLLRVCDFVDFG